jgi:hypothetical protein
MQVCTKCKAQNSFVTSIKDKKTSCSKCGTVKEKQQKNYDIELNIMVPAIAKFRILADSPEQAYEILKQRQPNPIHIKYFLPKKTYLTMSIKESMSCLILLTKRFLNGRLS